MRSCIMCGIDAMPVTEEWLEPLCFDHYAQARQRPPRTMLVFMDGRREMRNNYVYGKLYKDVVTQFDGSTGEIIPLSQAWFEHTWTHRDENGKPVMLCYSQIPEPTPSVIKKANAVAVKRRLSWWRRFVRWARLQWFMMGAG